MNTEIPRYSISELCLIKYWYANVSTVSCHREGKVKTISGTYYATVPRHLREILHTSDAENSHKSAFAPMAAILDWLSIRLIRVILFHQTFIYLQKWKRPFSVPTFSQMMTSIHCRMFWIVKKALLKINCSEALKHHWQKCIDIDTGVLHEKQYSMSEKIQTLTYGAYNIIIFLRMKVKIKIWKNNAKSRFSYWRNFTKWQPIG